jgi:antitoxin Phd
VITKTSAEAQNQFGQLLDLVQREPVIITRHGRPAAFMYSPRDIEELVSIQQRRDQAAKDRDARRKQGIESTSPATAGFTEADANQVAPKEGAPARRRVRGSR